MTAIDFTYKRQKVTIEVDLRGRPAAGESSEQARERKIEAAKAAYRASH